MGGISNGMKLWLDDARPAPPGWVVAQMYEEAVGILATGHVHLISLDYDLNLRAVATMPSGLAVATSDNEAKTGYDVALWIEDAVANGRIPQPEMLCHSTNDVGRQLIMSVIERMVPCAT